MTAVESVFGPYEVAGRIATGSTGTVWKASHPELMRTVAIKELAPELRREPGFLARFRAEAHLLGTLDHPNIVKVYDYVEEADRAWIVEEWVDGASVAAVVTAAGRLTAQQSLGVLRGALSGLAHAHARGLVHRDVTPSNILVDAAGTSKLVDFGLAAPTGTAGAAGTPAYMSPEAVQGGGVDARSDVYSSAAVLYELLTGAPMYAGTGAAEVLARQVSAPVPVTEAAGPRLRDLLRRALAKVPAQRPADASAFLAELTEAAAERYGAGWLGGASVVGAVGTALAGAAGGPLAGAGAGVTTVIAGGILADPPAGGPGGSAAGVDGPPALPDGLPASAGGALAPARRLLRPQYLLAAAAAVVVLGGGTAAAVTLGGNDKPAGPAAVASPRPSATTTNPADVAAATLTGTWAVTTTVTEEVGFDKNRAPGTANTTTWSMKGDCAAKACALTLHGNVFDVPYDLVVSPAGGTYTYRWSALVDCTASVPGGLAAKNGATYAGSVTLRLGAATYVGGRWHGTTLTGEIIGTGTPTAAGIAKKCGPAHLKYAMTGVWSGSSAVPAVPSPAATR
jgi:serine/threonine-protein kinase